MKIALITGAANGIGLALSRLYLQQGVITLMVDKNAPKLEMEGLSLKADFGDLVKLRTCDLTDLSQVQELATWVKDQLGHVDYLYNNAGIIGSMASVWELSPAQLKQVMDVNLYGTWHMIHAFMPLLLAQKRDSRIVNIASLYALCNSSQTAAYSISKHAVLALTESLYFDLERLQTPINVSVVFPSFTDTSLLSNQESNTAFQNSLHQLLSHSRPALEVAEHIVQAVENKQFYIFPDLEVKSYCDERTQAILQQGKPHVHAVEKIMGALLKRANRA
ncbi:MAG: SDR family NAD(P)-dependent oxidoreductase [Legionella sp.]|nr:MAG: SDR family NAD(P)-dependent oxidoreductase [Legionella sp.]